MTMLSQEKKEDEKPAEEAKPAESKSEDTETPTKGEYLQHVLSSVYNLYNDRELS